MKRVKTAATCLAVAVAMMPVPEPTVATNRCTCVEGFPKPSQAQLRQGMKAELDRAAGALFLGQVVSVEPYFAILKIEKAWKGKLGSTVRMRHATRASDGGMIIDTCEYQFEVRKKYLVLAEEVREGLMSARLCNLTQPAASASQFIRILDDLVKVVGP